MSTPIRTAADVPHVREVTLHGTADLKFWEERLKRESLVPVESGGRAQVMVIASHLKYMGVNFRELIITVPARRGATEGAWFPAGFNTCRIFCYMERSAFSTPYLFGEIRAGLTPPCMIELALDGDVVLGVSMGAKRDAAPEKEGGWEGPVFLPWDARGDESQRKVFMAKISGPTRTWAFDAARDKVELRAAPGREIFQNLIDSGFAGREWAVRGDARHVKSKTASAKEAFPI